MESHHHKKFNYTSKKEVRYKVRGSISFSKKPKKQELRPAFYQEIFDLENKLHYDLDFELIKTLTNLYREGIEYFSSVDLEVAAYFMNKLQELLMNRKAVQNMKSSISSQKSSKEITPVKITSEFTLTPNKSSKSPKINNLKSPKKDTVSPLRTRRAHTIAIKSTNKMESSWKKIMKQAKIGVQFKRLKIDGKKSEIFEKFEKNMENAKNIIQNELNEQEKSMKIRIRQIKFSHSNNELRKDSNKSTSINENKRKSNQSHNESNEDNFSIKHRFKTFINTNQVILQKSKKTIPINKVFEQFLEGFHLFFHKINEFDLMNKGIDITKAICQKRIENYIKYEDEIKELEFASNQQSVSNLFLLENNISLEREKLDIEIISSLHKEINSLIEINMEKKIDQTNELEELCTKLIGKLISLLN